MIGICSRVGRLRISLLWGEGTPRITLGDGFIRTERVISLGNFFRVRLVIEVLYNKRGSI